MLAWSGDGTRKTFEVSISLSNTVHPANLIKSGFEVSLWSASFHSGAISDSWRRTGIKCSHKEAQLERIPKPKTKLFWDEIWRQGTVLRRGRWNRSRSRIWTNPIGKLEDNICQVVKFPSCLQSGLFITQNSAKLLEGFCRYQQTINPPRPSPWRWNHAFLITG